VIEESSSRGPDVLAQHVWVERAGRIPSRIRAVLSNEVAALTDARIELESHAFVSDSRRPHDPDQRHERKADHGCTDDPRGSVDGLMDVLRRCSRTHHVAPFPVNGALTIGLAAPMLHRGTPAIDAPLLRVD
jgi:hypothetical protein